MSDLEELKRLAEAATPGPWEKRSYQSGTACVVMREWIGPKSKEYGNGFLAAHMTAYNIDFQDEHLIDAEKNATASFIAAANPSTILSLIQRVEEAEADRELFATPIAILQERSHAEGRLAGIEEAAGANALISKTHDTLVNMQPHLASVLEQAGPFCAAAQIVSDEISSLVEAIRALKEKEE